MAGRRLTVDDLLSEVRSLLDEENEVNISDVTDLLPALNRAQDYASNILARHYEQPLLAKTDVTLTSGTQEYSIPEDAFEQRLEKLELNVNGYYRELKQIDFRDAYKYETPTGTINTPIAYVMVGVKYRLLPAPATTYPLRLWYLKDPEPFVKSQGRITLINTGSNYVTVDSIGSDLTTEMTSLDSYVNVIDGQTGEIKATLQINSTSSNRITFKSVPTRSTVLNKTVASAIPSTVELDDLICTIHGSCVPYFKKPFSNFLIQYAVMDIKVNKLGEPGELLLAMKKDLEQQVERSWVGRESTLRVKLNNPWWKNNTRRFSNGRKR